MVSERPQPELLLRVHHLDGAALVASCEHCAVPAQTEGGEGVFEGVDFLDELGLGWVVDGDGAVVGVGEEV
jgi:hypothetical protein